MKKVLLRFAASTTLLLSVGVASQAQHYTQTNLVSNTAGTAPVTDPQLVNAWGLSRGPGSRSVVDPQILIWGARSHCFQCERGKFLTFPGVRSTASTRLEDARIEGRSYLAKIAGAETVADLIELRVVPGIKYRLKWPMAIST
jgi:hypothetical protein